MRTGFRFAVHRVRSAVNSLAAHAVILVYHRVTQLQSDPQWLCVTPDQFAGHLEILSKYYYPLQLGELQRQLQQGRVPRKAVAITFDDGYADNLEEARPLLERYDVPGTVFVATGNIEGKNEFWWDELESILFETVTLPKELSCSVNGKSYVWAMDGERVDPQKPDKGARPWNVTMDHSPTPRHRVYRELAPLLRQLSHEKRESTLQELAQWAGVPRRVRSTHRSLQAEEVVRLRDGGLVEIGAHTVHHPVLALEPLESQQRQIVESKQRLEEILSEPVSTFAYPYGGRGDYTADTVAAVRKAGFACACSNFDGWVQRRTNRYELPRYLVRDWAQDEFAERLAAWFNG